MQAPGYAYDQPAVNAREIADHVGHHMSGLVPAQPASSLHRTTDDSSPAVTIGSRIRTLRRARGLTQDTLAVSTGVSRSAVAQWETGRAGQMGSKLRRIAEALGVSVSMLKEGWEGLATDSVLSAEEISLLRMFRRCPAEDRTVLLHVAQKLAANPVADGDAVA